MAEMVIVDVSRWRSGLDPKLVRVWCVVGKVTVG